MSVQVSQWYVSAVAHNRHSLPRKLSPLMTAADLEKLAQDVRYEVEEFRKAVDKVAKITSAHADWNNTIESVLLHFRILRAFFFPDSALFYSAATTSMNFWEWRSNLRDCMEENSTSSGKTGKR